MAYKGLGIINVLAQRVIYSFQHNVDIVFLTYLLSKSDRLFEAINQRWPSMESNDVTHIPLSHNEYESQMCHVTQGSLEQKYCDLCIFEKFASLAEIEKTTTGVASDYNFIKMALNFPGLLTIINSETWNNIDKYI